VSDVVQAKVNCIKCNVHLFIRHHLERKKHLPW